MIRVYRQRRGYLFGLFEQGYKPRLHQLVKYRQIIISKEIGKLIAVISSNMSFDFRALDVYRRANDLIAKISLFCDQPPKMQYFLSDKLKRAALSILTNIAEGSGRWHSKDKRYFYLISRGSAYECVAIIDVCSRVRQIDEKKEKELLNDLLDISKMLTKLIQRFSRPEFENRKPGAD